MSMSKEISGDEIVARIREFEKKNKVSDLRLLAIISDTSREVQFYGKINGVRHQSNNMVEEEKLPPDAVEGLYDEVASIVRTDERFKPDKTNIVKASDNGAIFSYDERRCKTYKIVKEWEDEVAR